MIIYLDYTSPIWYELLVYLAKNEILFQTKINIIWCRQDSIIFNKLKAAITKQMQMEKALFVGGRNIQTKLTKGEIRVCILDNWLAKISQLISWNKDSHSLLWNMSRRYS